MTRGFLTHHPDLRHRVEGVVAFDAGRLDEAFDAFLRAARFADKPSQAMVAEMLWHGHARGTDRARAYAWMDLAAERGYPAFVVLRERYWAQLDAVEQARALEIGVGIYAEYGDDVAQPRLARTMDRGRRQITGSRVGHIGSKLTVGVWNEGGIQTWLAGDQYYADRYWRPDHYFAWQDRAWHQVPVGFVDVGSIESTP